MMCPPESTFCGWTGLLAHLGKPRLASEPDAAPADGAGNAGAWDIHLVQALHSESLCAFGHRPLRCV